jgi:predicted nucleotidyltransferase component of viral defense system
LDARWIWANCYAYEEAFGEKLRALGERTRPRDLYDVVNLYRHTDSRPTATVLLDVLRQKCTFKAIPVPTFQSLIPHREALEAMWSDMLSHQLPVLPSPTRAKEDRCAARLCLTPTRELTQIV